jgi:hypothetical protein
MKIFRFESIEVASASGSSMSRIDLESLVAWLRDCAARTARENRLDLRPVHGQLRIINALAREILVRRGSGRLRRAK